MQNNYPIMYAAMPLKISGGETLYIVSKGYLVLKEEKYQAGKTIKNYQIVFIYEAISDSYLNGFNSTYPKYDENDKCINCTQVKKVFSDFSDAQKYCNDLNLAVWHKVVNSNLPEQDIIEFKEDFYQVLIVEKIINATLKSIPIKESVSEQNIILLRDELFCEQNVSLYEYLRNTSGDFNIYHVSESDYNAIIASKYNPLKTENLGRLIMTRNSDLIINNPSNTKRFKLEKEKLVEEEVPIKAINGTKIYTKETEDDLINSYHLTLGIKKEIISKNL